MQIRQVILTGATGPIGIALTKYLIAKGISLTVLTRPGSKRNIDIPVSERVRIFNCDSVDFTSLSAKLERRYDAFFHLGWDTASREVVNDSFLQARNIIYTLEAVKLAHSAGCKVFVGTGSQAEYGRTKGRLKPDTPANPETSYGIAKYAAGRLSLKLCESLRMRHCWARILSVYGPHDRETTAIMYCISSLLKGEKPSLTKGEQVWDYLYSADCARALYLIAKKGKHGAVYVVGSGKGRPLREYFECTRDAINPKLMLGIGEKSYSDKQLMHLSADISSLTRDTGFKPGYSFARGLKETIAWAKTRSCEREAK